MARIYFGAKNQQWEGVITGSGIDPGEMDPRKSKLANRRKFLIYVNKDDGSQTSWSVNYSEYRNFRPGDRVKKQKGTLKVTRIST